MEDSEVLNYQLISVNLMRKGINMDALVVRNIQIK